jgi:pantoate--beta-alanine ligase
LLASPPAASEDRKPVPPPPVDRTIAALRARLAPWRAGGKIALVPTMGALHAGHLGLVRDARIRAAKVVVSIFVNPKQFAPTEDFGSYPRDEAADLGKLGDNGADVVFAPSADEMYPVDFATSVSVAGPALDLEGASRPHFFGGVATVVAKLFLAVQPDVAIFGEKDYQQLLVIRRMVADLAFPIEIAGHKTAREPDGLAMSSRNAYLSPDDRRKAPHLHKALQEIAQAVRSGVLPDMAIADASARLTANGFLIDYIKLRNADTLARVDNPAREAMRLLAAVWLSKTRLIDNIPV